MTLDEFLKAKKIPGISGIDTRALTKIIRKHSTMRATLTHVGDSMDHVTDQLQATVLPTDNIKQVSTKTSYPAPGVGLSVVLVDFGLKHSILRELSKRNCNVTVVPYSTTAEKILHLNPDGVMLSNGPGNPEDVPEALDMIRGVQGKIPIFGICMGHQLFAMANGAKTYKMKFGHRGFNHAVREIATGRVDFTSQNHGVCALAGLAGSGQPGIGLVGLGQRQLGLHVHEGVDVTGGSSRQAVFDQFTGRDVTGLQGGANGTEIAGFQQGLGCAHAYSTTRGTRYRPSATDGAERWFSAR